MKIALVHSFYSAATPSGENEVVRAQSAALETAGHEVLLVSASTDARAREAAHAVRAALTVGTGRGPSPTDELDAFRPDVVHVHNLFPNFGTAWLSSWNGPIVQTLHNFRTLCASGVLFRDGHDCVECPQMGSLASVRHKCYRGSATASMPLAWATRTGGSHSLQLTRPDQIVALSSRSRDTMEALAQVDFSGRLSVVPNFAPTMEPTAIGDTRDAWLMVGRLAPEKGSLKLLREWPAHEPLDVLGTGPDEVECRDVARDKDVRFLGMVPRDAVGLHLRSARGLILPSIWREGLPTIYLEALAAGVPTIALPGNSAADDIESSGTGIVISSIGEIASAIAQVELNAGTLGPAARARYFAAFTQDAWVAAIESTYRAAIARALARQ